ncbi:MAG TPA: hypothetical protein VIL36_01165 [Acidimicrobiales bacterium]
MRIGRIVAIGAVGALAAATARKLQRTRADRTGEESPSTLGEVSTQRPLDPEPPQRLDSDKADAVLRPTP